MRRRPRLRPRWSSGRQSWRRITPRRHRRRERPRHYQSQLTARPARCRASRQRSLDRTDSSHSAVTATTALHAPIRPLGEARSKGSGGLESARSRRGWPVTALRQGAAICATASEPPAAILFRTVCSVAAIADGPVRNGYLVIRRKDAPSNRADPRVSPICPRQLDLCQQQIPTIRQG